MLYIMIIFPKVSANNSRILQQKPGFSAGERDPSPLNIQLVHDYFIKRRRQIREDVIENKVSPVHGPKSTGGPDGPTIIYLKDVPIDIV